jgi:hypothetical protein
MVSLPEKSECWRIADVTICSDEIAFPVRYGRHNVSAVGKFRTVLHEPELSIAIKAGLIKLVHSIAYYDASVIFREFVECLWDYRKDAISRGDVIDADFFKLLLNGVLGKLGQRAVKWIDRPDLHASRYWGTEYVLDADTGQSLELRYICGRVQQRREIGDTAMSPMDVACIPEYLRQTVPLDSHEYNDESPCSTPQIAGAITSWGRVLLEETRNVAGPGEVYYTDTDCLHVSRAGLERLEKAGKIASGELGQLHVVAIAQSAEYRGIKHYRLDSDWTIAGRQKNATEPVDGRWTQEQFSGWQSMLSHGACTYLESRIIHCDRSADFIPGTVLSDGTITPISISAPASA